MDIDHQIPMGVCLDPIKKIIVLAFGQSGHCFHIRLQIRSWRNDNFPHVPQKFSLHMQDRSMIADFGIYQYLLRQLSHDPLLEQIHICIVFKRSDNRITGRRIQGAPQMFGFNADIRDAASAVGSAESHKFGLNDALGAGLAIPVTHASQKYGKKTRRILI